MERFFTYSLLMLSFILGLQFSFGAVVNDDCSAAMLLASPAPPNVACGGGTWLTAGTGLGTTYDTDQNGANSATHSTTTPVPSCGWLAGNSEDIWFKVQIPIESDGLDIEWENKGGCSGFLCSTDIRVAAYRAGLSGNCNSLTYISCVDKERFNIQAYGAEGEWIYLRVWEGDDQGFEIEFTQIRAIKNDCDECATATEILFRQPFDCSSTNQTAVPVTYLVNRSNGSKPTASVTSPLSGCQGAATPMDVWFTAVLPAKTGGVEIQFENLGGCVANGAINLCETDVAYAWYTTSTGDCSGLEFRGCDKVTCLFGCTDGKIRVDGKPGERVYIRIWEEDDQGFDIKINQLKPTAPADKCYTALPLEGIGCNYEATSPKNGPYAEPNAWGARAHTGTDFCDAPNNQQLWATNENTVWYTFNHAATGQLDLTIRNINCQGLGITPTLQMGVFSNAGGPNNPTCDLSTETAFGCVVDTSVINLNIPNLPSGDYILLVDGTGGNQCIWEFRGTNVFPVDLISFDAHVESRASVLSWVTANEVNNSGFEIMRSADGEHYESIDFVAAQPFPNGPDGRYEYQFIDTEVAWGGRFYYRLKQVDQDGSYTMSNVVELTIPYEASQVTLLPMYPNPAQVEVTIPFFLGERDGVMMGIFSLDGRLNKTIIRGTSFEAGKHEVKLNTRDLPAGMYVIKFQAGGKLLTRKLVITK